MAKEFDLTGVGAWYLRKSEDRQDLDSQRDAVSSALRLAGALDRVPKQFQFEDSGARSEHATREDFRRLLTMADKGMFKWVVVDEAQRILTDDTFESMAYLNHSARAGFGSMRWRIRFA
jgi:DNA invertase Pin-like site-specific DNA recombinase